MTTPSDGKVIVRVEVVIEGLGAPAKATASESVDRAAVAMPSGPLPQCRSIRPQAIPPFPANVPVYIIGGQNCIEAAGTSPYVGGAYAQTVQAIAYNTPGVTPPATPPAGAVTDTPAGGQNWSFTRVKGNPVPGAAYDNISDGPNNSTLAVWYFYDGNSPAQQESCSLHGYIASSGAAPALAIARGAAGPAVLHATFTGALAPLQTVALTWNGVSWAGESSVGGGCVLSLLCRDETFQLMAAGPGAAFLVSAPSRASQPFSWTAEGSAYGTLSGCFGVIIVE